MKNGWLESLRRRGLHTIGTRYSTRLSAWWMSVEVKGCIRLAGGLFHFGDRHATFDDKLPK